ncbi:MAG: hypothetical protein LBS49_05550 [Candidatus Accumulibacter sp.]|jgi:hypothetical protein|nr:hypothetical protein [Accumulibacter sp.]
MTLLSSIGYASIGFAVLKGAVIGLFSGVVITLIMRRLGLFKRDGKFHSIIVKLYYLYIPAALAALCIAWFTISAVQTEALSFFAQLRQDIVGLSVSAARRADGEIRKLTGGRAGLDAGLPSVAKTVSTVVDEAFASKLRDYPALNSLLAPIRNSISETLTKQLLDILAAKLSEAMGSLGLSPDSVGGFMTNGMIMSLEGGLFAEIIEVQLNRQFEGFLGKVRMAGIIMALPVLLELGIFFYGRRKRRRQASLG